MDRVCANVGEQGTVGKATAVEGGIVGRPLEAGAGCRTYSLVMCVHVEVGFLSHLASGYPQQSHSQVDIGKPITLQYPRAQMLN